jgi:uncharacterized membrane protein
MRPLLFALAALLLTAPVALAAPPISGKLDLGGTEPFWSARIRPGYLSFRADAEGKTEVYRGVRVRQAQGWTVWSAGSGAGKIEFRLRRNARCDDGMSDRYYPYDAWVVFASGGRLEGCAYRAGRLPPDIVYPQ